MGRVCVEGPERSQGSAGCSPRQSDVTIYTERSESVVTDFPGTCAVSASCWWAWSRPHVLVAHLMAQILVSQPVALAALVLERKCC